MVKKIICSIFASVIIAFTIFLIVMNIPEKNHDELIIGGNYKEIQEKFFSKEFKINDKMPKISDQDIDTSTKGKYYFQLSSDSIEKNRDLIEKYQKRLKHYCDTLRKKKEIENLPENKKLEHNEFNFI